MKSKTTYPMKKMGPKFQDEMRDEYSLNHSFEDDIVNAAVLPR